MNIYCASPCLNKWSLAVARGHTACIYRSRLSLCSRTINLWWLLFEETDLFLGQEVKNIGQGWILSPRKHTTIQAF